MSEITLAGIELPGDLYWSDEFTSWKVGQAARVSLTGALIVHQSALQAGRPITLESQQEGNNWVGWLTLVQLEALRALEADPLAGPFTLVMPAHNTGTRSFQVMFRRDGVKAIEARPVRFISPYVDGDVYAATIRLMEI